MQPRDEELQPMEGNADEFGAAEAVDDFGGDPLGGGQDFGGEDFGAFEEEPS